jgi:hypothetical protein
MSLSWEAVGKAEAGGRGTLKSRRIFRFTLLFFSFKWTWFVGARSGGRLRGCVGFADADVDADEP